MSQFGGYCFVAPMNSVHDAILLGWRVSPFGYLRVNAVFQLTEAYRRFRALLRLSMPRHPPAALNSLTKKIDYKLLSSNFIYFLKRQLLSQSIL